jgi:hypothetical protein
MLTFLVHKILTFYLNVVLKLYVQLQGQRVKNRGVRCWTVVGNRSRIGKRENICAELKSVVLSRNYKPTLQFFSTENIAEKNELWEEILITASLHIFCFL